MNNAARLKVLFIVPHPVEGPSTRFRVSQFLPYLAAGGIDGEVRPLFGSAEARIIYGEGRTVRKALLTLRAAVHRMIDVASAGRYDLVYVLREAFPFGPPVFEALLAHRAGRMVFDFDDAIYVRSTAYRNALDRLRDFGKPAWLCRRADIVVPGSRHLAMFARHSGAAVERISILPTVVDTDAFRPDPARRNAARLTIGWIGTPRGTSYLHALRPAMIRLAAAHPEARFVFVGAEPFECPGVDISFPPWALEREVSDLQSFDIGLMPLADDEEARGKCGFKIIEYMAAGAVVVCSPVGANCDIVDDGVTGLFAMHPDDWGDALLRLAGDKELRGRLAAAGRCAAQERFSFDVIAPRLLAVIRAAAMGRILPPIPGAVVAQASV